MSKKFTLNALLILSCIAISFAYFVEFYLGHQPCNLCKIERIPYLASIILISLLFIINKGSRFVILSLLVLFALGTLISFYHVGIEQGFFSESFVCSLGQHKEYSNTQELLDSLKNTRISCQDVTFRIVGLSLATINTFLSFVISIILIKLYIKYEKN